MGGRRRWILFPVLFCLLLLTGCMASSSVENLYALPEPPEEFQALSVKLSAILSAGAEYTSPTSGANLQSIQMEDLDGDGQEEVLAFFRVSSEERPLKIYIFRPVDDAYEEVSRIEGSGTSFHSIRYVDMDGNGTKELLISWRVSAELQAITVYTLSGLEPVMLMSTAYARYETADLNGDDLMELIVLHTGEGEAAGTVADYYSWESGSLVLRSTARLSVSVAELLWVQIGALTDGQSALFVTGRVTGGEGTSKAVTDILVYREAELRNIALSSSTGVSTQITDFINLQSADMNGDGVTETPRPIPLTPTGGDTPLYQVYWSAYTPEGESELQTITFHNPADSWYLTVPQDWDGLYTVRMTGSGSAERAATFLRVNGFQVGDPLFTIYTLTGANRASQAERDGRQVLRGLSTGEVLYAIRYEDSYERWPCAISREELESRIHLIQAQWSTGEN